MITLETFNVLVVCTGKDTLGGIEEITGATTGGGVIVVDTAGATTVLVVLDWMAVVGLGTTLLFTILGGLAPTREGFIIVGA